MTIGSDVAKCINRLLNFVLIDYGDMTNEKLIDKQSCKAIFSSDVRSYADEPFFVKKAEDAKEKVSKLVLPGNKK